MSCSKCAERRKKIKAKAAELRGLIRPKNKQRPIKGDGKNGRLA